MYTGYVARLAIKVYDRWLNVSSVLARQFLISYKGFAGYTDRTPSRELYF